MASLLFLYAGHFKLDFMNSNLESLETESAAVAILIRRYKDITRCSCGLRLNNGVITKRSARHAKKDCFYFRRFYRKTNSFKEGFSLSELCFVLPTI